MPRPSAGRRAGAGLIYVIRARLDETGIAVLEEPPEGLATVRRCVIRYQQTSVPMGCASGSRQAFVVSERDAAVPSWLPCVLAAADPASYGLQAARCPGTVGSRSALGAFVLTEPGFLVILLTMTVLPLGDVKSHLSELVGRVHDHHERVTVTVHGRPSAVLIAPEDLEALEETLEIMRDAATMNRLAESDAELARGEYVSAAELAEAMRRRRAQ
jgi:antitoxin YefM